ncbi:MAG: ankyrin repeat domain-containing protein [Pirellulaceae bacterium]
MKYIVTAVALVLVVAVIARAWVLANLNDFGDPMLNAARDGDVPELRKLLANGADANRSDAYGNTPLSIAAHFGQTAAAEFLITHGAAIEGSENGEMTPLQCAVYSRHPRTAACLLGHNADPNRADKYGTTALMLAAANGDVALVTDLLSSGADVELADAHGWRALHIALRSTRPAESDRRNTVMVLLQNIADPNADNPGGSEQDSEHDSHLGWRSSTLPNQGNTPLAIATSNGFTEIIGLLEEHGAK